MTGAIKFICIKKIEGRMMFLFSRTNKQLILVVLSILHCALIHGVIVCKTRRNLLVQSHLFILFRILMFSHLFWIKKLFVTSYIFLWQNINFTDEFYAPPVVIVTAKHINNDSRLSGCNAITAWVEVKLFYKLADSKRLI